MVVTRNNQASAPQSLQVGPFSPGIFAIGTIAVAINPDGSIAAPAGAIPGIATKPAKIGDPGGLVILCTGLGAVDSIPANGAASLDKLRTATTTPTVMIGGKAAHGGLRRVVPAVRRRQSDQHRDSRRHSDRRRRADTDLAGQRDHQRLDHDRGEQLGVGDRQFGHQPNLLTLIPKE